MDLSLYKSKDLVEIVCEHCNTSFKRIKRDIVRYTSKGLKQYCSAKCQADSKRIEVQCKQCGTNFTIRKSELVKRKFCNRRCAAVFSNATRKIIRYCLWCSRETKNGKCCNNTCNANYQAMLAVENGTATNVKAKRYLLATYGKKCWKCKNTEWNKLPITLELEHVDGNSSNNSLNNLEILCPNCHSQTSTYKAKNKGNGRHSRRERYREGKSF